jgi:hypothetical protein
MLDPWNFGEVSGRVMRIVDICLDALNPTKL